MRITLAILLLLNGLYFGPVNFADADERQELSDVDKDAASQIFEFHGSAEVTIQTTKGFDEDLAMTRRETEAGLTFDVELLYSPSEWARAVFISTWDDEDAFKIEETYVEIGNRNIAPANLAAGKMTLPFGYYENTMYSDPLPLELGEMRTQAILLGLEVDGINAALFVANDESFNDGGGYQLSSWGGDVHYLRDDNEFRFLLGASWLENLADANEYNLFIQREDLYLTRSVPGLAYYLSLTANQVALSGTTVMALEKPVFINQGAVEEWSRPEAWSAEIAYHYEGEQILGATAAITYSESKGSVDFLPKKRIGGAVRTFLNEYVSLTFEYLREYDYPIGSGGAGDHQDIISLVAFVGF